jgi:ATP-binding cassette subfamily B (MDR/TAP) protein 9
MKWVYKYTHAERWSLFWNCIILLIGQTADYATPLFIGLAMTAIEEGKLEKVGTYCWQLFLIVIVSGVFVGIRAYQFNMMSQRIAVRLRHDFFENVINKDIEYFESVKTGDLISRLNADTDVIENGLSTNVSMFLRCGVSIIASLIILFILSPILTLAFLAGFIPLVFFSIKFGHVMKDVAKDISNEKAKMSTIADESISNIRVVKAFANEGEEISKFNARSDDVYKYGQKKFLWQGLFGAVTQLSLYGAMALQLYVANELYKKGELKIGTISAFLMYLLSLLINFWILNFVFANVMNVFGASTKLFQIMNLKTKITTEGGLCINDDGRLEGRIELRNVKFHYPSKPKVQVLKGINLTIDNKKNRVVALCGTSGCGKSSIISMIERFYDPEDGFVLFNGVNIKYLDPRWYHENVAIV